MAIDSRLTMEDAKGGNASAHGLVVLLINLPDDWMFFQDNNEFAAVPRFRSITWPPSRCRPNTFSGARDWAQKTDFLRFLHLMLVGDGGVGLLCAQSYPT